MNTFDDLYAQIYRKEKVLDQKVALFGYFLNWCTGNPKHFVSFQYILHQFAFWVFKREKTWVSNYSYLSNKRVPYFRE